MATHSPETGAANDGATTTQTTGAGGSSGNGDNGNLGAFVTQEVHQVVIATSSFVVTIVALLASAFGVVAALAWNKAISDWLTTVTIFDVTDPRGKEFVDAIVITVIAIVGVTALGIIASRVRGRNLLIFQQPVQSKDDAKKK